MTRNRRLWNGRLWNRKLLIPALLAGLVALVVAGNLYRNVQGPAPLPVTTAVVKRGPVTSVVSAGGVVEARDPVNLRATAEVTLGTVWVRAGDLVEKGARLLEFDREELEARASRAAENLGAARGRLVKASGKGPEEARLQVTLAELRVSDAELELKKAQFGAPVEQELARNRLEKARADLEVARLAADPRVWQEELAAARAAVAAAEASYRQARDALQAATLVAPAPGTVLEVAAGLGEVVRAGGLLVTIADLSRVMVKAKVDETELGRVSHGQEAEINSPAYPDERWPGKVNRIAPRGERQENATYFQVEVEADNTRNLLRPGMSVDVDFITGSKEEAVVVPAEAVVERDGAKAVFVVEGGRARLRKVKIGLRESTRLEITEGLEAGEMVVTGRAEVLRKLADGDRVKPLAGENSRARGGSKG